MAKRNRQRNQNVPVRRPNSTFRIDIELDAVVDYMTMLRGFSAHGEFYDGFVSDQLTRFPSFDGSDWQELLPEGITFESFVSDATTGNSPNGRKLFDRVRPYDFAYRDLTYLRRNGAQIVLHVPPLFEAHIGEIKKWSKKYFPPNADFKPIRVEPLTNDPQRKSSDIWVVRNPDSASDLKTKAQPFILIDGKENADIPQVNRVIRWDQAGFLIRHAQLIKHLSANNPGKQLQKQPILRPIHPPHMDVLRGNAIQLLLADDALLWIGKQIRSINIAISSPESALRHGRRSTKTREQFSDDLAVKVLSVLAADKQEVTRKAEFLTKAIDNKMDQILANPDWTSILKSREERMAQVLSDLESELRIDPVTGGELSGRAPNIARTTTTQSLGDRLLLGNPNTPIVLQLSGVEMVHLLSRHWSAVSAQIFDTEPSKIAGHLAEIAINLIIDEGKWKLLRPTKEANGHSSKSIVETLVNGIQKIVLRNGGEQILSNRRIDLSWHDLDTGEIREAEVDFVAKGPGNKIVIGEVKLSDGSSLSDLQVALRNHIVRGGRMINPGFSGVRGKTFEATWREVRINDQNFDLLAPINDISTMSHTR